MMAKVGNHWLLEVTHRISVPLLAEISHKALVNFKKKCR